VKNEAHKTSDREPTRLVNKELSDLSTIPTPEGHSICEPFRPEEFTAALRLLKPGKSPGLDSIFPEFLPHARSAIKSWFCDFLNSCMRQLKIPNIWRRALVVAILKPEKQLGDPKAYRPISLLCVPFKILKRLIYARVETITDSLLPQEQAGFRHGRSAADQVTLLTQDIADSFSVKKKAGAVFVDLTAAGNRQTSRLRRLKNGVPQGFVLAPLLFNIFTSVLPATISRKYAYADNLAIMHADGDWLAVKGALTKDMATLSEYLQSWKLKLSTTKTVSAVFHLNNKESKRELN